MEEQKFFKNKKIYTLLDVSESLKQVLARNYTKDFYVKAEIGKLNYYPHSGHCYPDLVHKQGQAVKAQIRGMIWAHDYAKIASKFIEITKNPLSDGLSILFLATLSYHPTYGISLIIKDIEPEFSLGEMVKDRQAAINKLKDEKIFNLNKTKHLPLFPKKIAIVSVATGKGYQDYMNIMNDYIHRYQLLHILFPALLQGEGAVQSILAQLKLIKQYADYFDMVIIIRGGGGDVGLTCYDNYALAKEIATFPIPVITGIGHATNQSVVELVAYHSSITPNDTANFILNTLNNYINSILSFEKILANVTFGLLQTKQQQLFQQGNTLKILSEKLIGKYKQLLKFQQMNINFSAGNVFKFQCEKLNYLSGKLEILNPENILKRGFSITTLNNKIVTDATVLHSGDIIETKVYQGSFGSIIK